ncbi:hypothetical protein ABAC460_04280 [Asticcacaulis sp. AC460]|uniref:radical SAM protein n=1 Tax=Asticcacaulis sp. AC460 TaxID=1282360 RepID=UPI0003C40B94|nr:radical SAM protein [Asticcacaulis sp. AC460]ESQ92109.1 hypothetical protein ABAC460_04280 [Asticcacaulis sp. AC460]
MSLSPIGGVTLQRLQVIYKTVERCNLACPYCYYFYGSDQSYKDRPARTRIAVVDALCDFLIQGVEDADIAGIDLIFHGGEPMLQRLADFEESCRRLRDRVGTLTTLRLSIQTNGTKLDEAWLGALKRHGVRLGVSLDGPDEIHDKNRVYHNGKGSFADIAARLHRVRQADPDYYDNCVGSLTVLDAHQNYRDIVSYFYSELHLRQQSFLLPDCTHDDGIPGGLSARDYGHALCGIFDQWLEQPGLQIREIEKILRCFQKASFYDTPETVGLVDGRRVIDNQVIVVQSDGAIKVDDSYIPAEIWRSQAPVRNIQDTSLANYVTHAFFDEFHDARQTPPTACKACMWVNICRGGDVENRWSTERRFDNPSVFCESLQIFYEHVVRYLVTNGYPLQDIYRRLADGPRGEDFGYAA